MKHLFIAGCIALLALVSVPAVAEDKAAAVITGMEYEVFKTVLAEYPSYSVDKATLSSTFFGELVKGKFFPPLDPDIIGDLNEKNKVACELPAEFIVQVPADQGRLHAGNKYVQLSRVGFDKESGKALVVVKTTYVAPRDVMNEGEFILLSSKDGKWTVEKKAEAWGTMLGE